MIQKLIHQIRDHFSTMEDPRKGKNKSYSFVDITTAAYSIFHMQSPSFLAHQERLNHEYGKHNGMTLFGFTALPSDNQMRQVLDHVNPSSMHQLFDRLHNDIDKEEFKAQDGLVVALDGVNFFSSEKISCSCCTARVKDNKTRYYHAALVPALIHPEQKYALPMSPEFITNQDGNDKQDCEINAAKRWCKTQNAWLTQNKVTILGDDLFSRTPMIKQLLEYKDLRFIFVAKPSSHKYLAEWVSDYEHCDIQCQKVTEKMGNKKHVFHYRIYRDVPLTGDADSLYVNYFEMIVTDKNNKQIYYNTFVTNHDCHQHNIHAIARMGRNRWRIENEAFNILKTKGYNLEHNFGHGKKNLSNLLICFNLLAFLVHHISEKLSELFKHTRECFGARVRFFEALSFAVRIQVFDSWDDFLMFILNVSRPIKRLRRSK